MIVECLCPPRADGTPRHANGDEITLRERLGFRAVTTIRWGLSLQENPSLADTFSLLTEQYVMHGVETWTVTDAKGRPVPVTQQTIRDVLLVNDKAAQDVADAADDKYGEVILPLLVRVSASSPATPTDDSISASPSLPPKRPRRSKRSSTTTSRMAGTATITTLHAGGSSSSPNSRLGAVLDSRKPLRKPASFGSATPQAVTADGTARRGVG